MVRNFGVDKLASKHVKQIMKMYDEKIARLKRRLDETIDSEERTFLEQKIERLKQKYQAVSKEFLQRTSISADVQVVEDTVRKKVRTKVVYCPNCGAEPITLETAEYDGILVYKCPECGYESREQIQE